ncbi:MAG: arginine--tRNA ligase [Candidatus Zixiibacteriota bacterium]
MKKDRFKKQFADAVATAFQRVYSNRYRREGTTQVFDPEFVYRNLEKPKDPRMGRFAFPVFRYSRLLCDKPDSIASQVAAGANEELKVLSGNVPVVTCEAVKGFLNARMSAAALAQDTIQRILDSDSRYGDSEDGRQRKFLVEYSSPNIAKPFGVGHLRTTILGNSLRRIFQKLGFDVVGINYLGDWGTQFGKMIVAFDRWGKGVALDNHAVEDLYELYVRFHDEAETDESLNEEARAAFLRLERGEKHETELWEKFKTLSLSEFDRIYETLGVEFDFVTGESFLNDKMDAVIDRLEKAGLARTSEGALIVELGDSRLPPCLLRKADGATLYATRDLAGLVYRWETCRFHESLYVVATSQSDHFKQAFKVIELLEEAEKLPESERMAGRVKHVDFGWVKFEDKTMSTRRGNIIILEDVLHKAVTLAEQRITEKNPDLLKKEDKSDTGIGPQYPTALAIGVGAVIFSQLSARRQKDINFDWNEVLNFEGETGPYLQYTHARLRSLMRNYSGTITSEIDYTLLDQEEENRVVELLADFPDTIQDAAQNYDPYYIAAHLLKLASAFNKVYQRKDADGRIDKIVSDKTDLSAARMALVKAAQVVIKEGLRLLGLQAPEEM